MKDDPGARGQKLAKKVVSVDDATRRREHAESLPAQCLLMRESTYTPDIWATAVASLNSEALKFSLNAATDTLPTKSNLAKWRKVLDQCKLCGKKQTLLHVLNCNNCEKALQLCRYNTRHDRILSDIANLAQTYLPDEYHLTVDLSEVNYQFPLNIVPTNLRPDLVMWSDVHKALHLVELTVCFESGFEEAARRKVNRYAELATEACVNGYTTQPYRLVVVECWRRLDWRA